MKKYQYHVLTWGGFYNKEHQVIHNLKEGDFLFDTKEERSNYIKYLRTLSVGLNAHSLCLTETEGYNCDVRTKLHRVIEFNGIEFYSENDMGVNYPYGAANFHLEWKWQPGFNDYPLGEGFNYDEVTIKQEWVSGAFNHENE